MKNKDKRLNAIRRILSTIEAGSQENIQKELKKVGIIATQATLSRDLKQLKAVKTTTADGNYVYRLPENTMVRHIAEPQIISDFINTSGFLSLRVSGNIIVVHTKPGYASSIAYHIDSASIPGIIGTIAGDDTIFIVIDDTDKKEETVGRLRQIFNPA